MQIHFSASIPLQDHAEIQKSALFAAWLQQASAAFSLRQIEVECVDWIKSHGGRKPLFLKLRVEASRPDGTPLPKVVFLRGHAVAVLVVLWCEEQPYLLLVEQPRLPLGDNHSLEIVAGILDWSQDWREVALQELREEANLQVERTELIDLMQVLGKPDQGVATSVGLLDERVYMAALERVVSRAELSCLHGQGQQYTAENEGIRTLVYPYQEAQHLFTDAKCLVALFLYERWLASQNRRLAL